MRPAPPRSRLVLAAEVTLRQLPIMLEQSPVLLYDGDCGFCAGSVQFVLARESPTARLRLRFAPLQGEFGATVFEHHPELIGVDSVVWFEPRQNGTSRVRVRSDAALSAAAHLGGVWQALAAVGHFIPSVLRDWVYDMIARRRLSIAAPACFLPSAEQRARFLK